MRGEDRVFLNDFAQFGFMNHIVAARAFYKAAAGAENAAAELRADAEGITLAEGARQAAHLNDAPRVQRIAVARLYAELAACIEDAGALHYAVRHRDKDGVFARYLDSGPADVGTFFDHVLSHRIEGLDTLLKLPTIDAVAGQVSPEQESAIRNLYTRGGEDLAEVAEFYRTAIPPGTAGPRADLPPDWAEQVNIVLTLTPLGATVKQRPGGLLALTYNKIKHRFTVIEDFDSFVAATASTHEVRYAHHSLQSDPVDRLFRNVVRVALACANLAALLILLDQQGVVV